MGPSDRQRVSVNLGVPGRLSVPVSVGGYLGRSFPSDDSREGQVDLRSIGKISR